MKIRQDFVTNSSSSSFILSKKRLTEKQILAIKHHREIAERMGMYNYDCSWRIEENDDFIGGYTGMDNFSMYDFLDKIGVCGSSAIWSEYYRGLPTEPHSNKEFMPKWEEVLNDIMAGIPYDSSSELNELIDSLGDEGDE